MLLCVFQARFTSMIIQRYLAFLFYLMGVRIIWISLEGGGVLWTGRQYHLRNKLHFSTPGAEIWENILIYEVFISKIQNRETI